MVRAPWEATKPQGTWKGEEGSDPPSAYEMPEKKTEGPTAWQGNAGRLEKKAIEATEEEEPGRGAVD